VISHRAATAAAVAAQTARSSRVTSNANDSDPSSVNTPAGLPADADDLGVHSEQFEVTLDFVAANLTFADSDGMKLPDDMVSAFERVWLDDDFAWPTTVQVTRILLSVEPDPSAEPPQEVWSRVSILGTGWEGDRPVTLRWTNAAGFPGGRVDLPAAQPGAAGFFGIDIVLKTSPRRAAEFAWGKDAQLALVAEQSAPEGAQLHRADDREIPPHVLWQWIR